MYSVVTPQSYSFYMLLTSEIFITDSYCIDINVAMMFYIYKSVYVGNSNSFIVFAIFFF